MAVFTPSSLPSFDVIIIAGFLSDFRPNSCEKGVMSDLRSFEVCERHSLESSEPPGKRRKVRKGTKSCWECKLTCSFVDVLCKLYPIAKGHAIPELSQYHHELSHQVLGLATIFKTCQPNIAYDRPETKDQMPV